MGDKVPGSICVTQVGTQWVDGGTLCLAKSPLPGPSGLGQQSSLDASDAAFSESEHGGYLWQTAKGQWVFSEFPQIGIDRKKPNPRVELTISVDEKNLAVGKARYTGAVHLNKNLAIHPGGPGNAGTTIIHSNIEFHIRVDGKKVPMTRRRVRYWGVNFAVGATVANGGHWEVDLSAGTKPPFWDNPGAEDAPAMNYISRPPKTTGDIHEFVAGTSKFGGYYYQVVTIYDPDGTAREMVYNIRPLAAKEFSDTIKRIDRGADRHAFLFDAELTEDRKYSDTGILTDIPDIVKRKQKIPGQ